MSFSNEDYIKARESVKFGVVWEMQRRINTSITIRDVFDYIFKFINEFSLFPESPHKLREYIDTNNISLNEKRRILDHIIFGSTGSFEEMLDLAVDYALCLIVYDGYPKDIKKFRKTIGL